MQAWRTNLELAAHGLTLLGTAAVVVVALVNPEGFAELVRKDSYPDGGGFFERATSPVLFPGIVAGAYAWWRWRSKLPRWWLRWGLLGWVAACFYFAGEECSWGQWYFGWGTPEVIAEVNAQGETNLHNTSSWLNQKPRAAIELFIIVGGFLAPVMLLLAKRSEPNPREPLAWILAPRMCWSAGLLNLGLWICSRLEVDPITSRLGESELREFTIAWFLSLYLISFPVRLSKKVLEEAPAPATGASDPGSTPAASDSPATTD